MQPRGPILPELARALGVSADQLLGLQPVPQENGRKRVGLLKRLRRVEHLPPADQRAGLKFVDALREKHGFA